MDAINKYKTRYNCDTFINKIYSILDIKQTNKTIKIYNEDYIYLEREYPNNKTDINVLSVSYFYKNHSRRIQYIDSVIENLKYMDNYFNDWYIFLHIDLSVLYLILSDNDIKNIFKTLCSDKRVLLQFYYCNNGIIENDNKIIHNNTLGSYIRYLPFVINDNINFALSCEIESLFTSYFHKLLYEDFNKEKDKELFIYQCGWPLMEHLEITKYLTYHKKYIIDGITFIGSINGYKKINNNSNIKLYQDIYRKFILNDIKDIVHKNNHNYEYGIDEVFILYFYYTAYHINNKHPDNIKIYGVNNNHKEYYLISQNLTEVFNNLYYIGEKSHRVIDVSIIRVWLIMYFYNNEYIYKNSDLYNGFKNMFDNIGLDIEDINNYINYVKHKELYQSLYKIIHINNYNDFIKHLVNHNHYYIIGHKKYVDIKLIHNYKI